MAKKKRGMPTKTCVNSACGAAIHARSSTCPHCGAAQPAKGESSQSPQAPASPARQDEQIGVESLSQAVSFIRQVGGLEKAKSLLTTIEEIKNL